METVVESLFFLQDSRGLVGDNLVFWAVGGGYTSDICRAELFTQECAVGQHQSRLSDIPWPAEYVKAHAYTAVDMQDMRRVNRDAGGAAFYKQIPGRCVGNDLLFFSEDGRGETTDLRRAQIFSSLSAGCVMWPVEEIQKIVRPKLRALDASINDALKGTGIVLQRPNKTRCEVFNCHECGRFISEVNRYNRCPNCGADNGP